MPFKSPKLGLFLATKYFKNILTYVIVSTIKNLSEFSPSALVLQKFRGRKSRACGPVTYRSAKPRNASCRTEDSRQLKYERVSGCSSTFSSSQPDSCPAI